VYFKRVYRSLIKTLNQFPAQFPVATQTATATSTEYKVASCCHLFLFFPCLFFVIFAHEIVARATRRDGDAKVVSDSGTTNPCHNAKLKSLFTAADDSCKLNEIKPKVRVCHLLSGFTFCLFNASQRWQPQGTTCCFLLRGIRMSKETLFLYLPLSEQKPF